MTRLTAILMCLALAGCTIAVSETQVVNPGAEVTLAAGATASVKNTAMKVRFVAVTEDSRCPRDVTCIWAGEIKVLFAIGVAPAASQVEIREGGSTAAGGYRVTLVRVEPQRTSAAKIAPKDYRATLKVEKAS
ncbi:MAG TPA: hypothetical protein VGO61_22940 [Steroidobacteraceae bacterium]|jgi:hypothetical protein|nr:hypothetical protein [Steroidobacteraceae bacterium]